MPHLPPLLLIFPMCLLPTLFSNLPGSPPPPTVFVGHAAHRACHRLFSPTLRLLSSCVVPRPAVRTIQTFTFRSRFFCWTLFWHVCVMNITILHFGCSRAFVPFTWETHYCTFTHHTHRTCTFGWDTTFNILHFGQLIVCFRFGTDIITNHHALQNFYGHFDYVCSLRCCLFTSFILPLRLVLGEDTSVHACTIPASCHHTYYTLFAIIPHELPFLLHTTHLPFLFILSGVHSNAFLILLLTFLSLQFSYSDRQDERRFVLVVGMLSI